MGSNKSGVLMCFGFFLKKKLYTEKEMHIKEDIVKTQGGCHLQGTSLI